LVESAANGESAGDLAAIILEDINNPTLMDIIVSSSSPGSSEVIAWLALVAKSEAAVLEDNVTTLGEKTTHLLEALLGECVQGIGGDLLAVGDRWGLVWEHGLTELGTSEEVGARVNVWLWCVGEFWDGVIWVLEVEHVDEGGHVLTSPWVHFGSGDVEALGGQPVLEEQDLGVVIGVLHEDAASTGPWRDDGKRKTVTGTGVGEAYLLVRVLEPLTHGAVRRVVWDNVIKPSSSLVVGDDEGRGFVEGAGSHSVDNLLLEPGTITRSELRMLRELSRADDVGDGGKGAIRTLVKEGLDVLSHESLLIEGRSWSRGLVLFEPGKWVVIEVVCVMSIRGSPILVKHPRDTSLLQKLGGGFPLEWIAVESVAALATGGLIVVNVRVSSHGGVSWW
jgi:hypothetical protein